MFLQGSDHLTVTWKVAEGIYQHIDVREEGKENAFSLGEWEQHYCFTLNFVCKSSPFITKRFVDIKNKLIRMDF